MTRYKIFKKGFLFSLFILISINNGFSSDLKPVSTLSSKSLFKIYLDYKEEFGELMNHPDSYNALLLAYSVPTDSKPITLEQTTQNIISKQFKDVKKISVKKVSKNYDSLYDIAFDLCNNLTGNEWENDVCVEKIDDSLKPVITNNDVELVLASFEFAKNIGNLVTLVDSKSKEILVLGSYSSIQ